MKDSYKAFPPMAALELFKFGWKSVLTVQHSPLKKLHPQVAHMLFLILGFMWSGIFAASVGSIQWFGFSAFVHVLIISGIMITYTVFNEAEKRPHTFNNFKLKKGYHSYPRARQNMYIDGKKVRLENGDPGGEHE